MIMMSGLKCITYFLLQSITFCQKKNVPIKIFETFLKHAYFAFHLALLFDLPILFSVLWYDYFSIIFRLFQTHNPYRAEQHSR